jgi:hypothetical protein
MIAKDALPDYKKSQNFQHRGPCTESGLLDSVKVQALEESTIADSAEENRSSPAIYTKCRRVSINPPT